MPRAIWWSYGGKAVSYERGTPVRSDPEYTTGSGSGDSLQPPFHNCDTHEPRKPRTASAASPLCSTGVPRSK
ncbi:hypothetical protein T484DRAFT_1935956 [Baffinella frigidus]|nr:hypothetical protein T484DRAFT_1935956 [Cryptophyta sp. CCMP2293]